ncbi:TlpA family protein disulfide reductase [Cohnella thermotolerans]|uniref:TlpA family protein disulfide reductase n=1 Tax=Cohnella thermotolerans TaxID=329858 RepID=UPI000A06D496|nr:TlpA disulfide reductase family protein [Cohnella thermotolerans]
MNMRTLRRRFAMLVAAILSGIVLYGAAAGPAAASRQEASAANGKIQEAPRIGSPAPSFTLKGMDGDSYSLRQFRGKPVVLNFWASWCDPCKEEAPSFAKLRQAFGSDLEVVAVNLTAVDSEKSARAFASSYGFDFPVLMDRDGSVADRYRIRPIPSTFFIDKNGVIADGAVGSMTWENLKAKADRLVHP